MHPAAILQNNLVVVDRSGVNNGAHHGLWRAECRRGEISRFAGGVLAFVRAADGPVHAV